MPAIISTFEQRRIRNLGMSAIYSIAAETGCEPSDVIDLLVTAPFTPSQPEASSKPHAPAAQTDGEIVAPPAASPSVYYAGARP